MEMTTVPSKTPLGTASGTWRVDPQTSTASFSAATLWGRIPVRGHLGQVTGTLRWHGADGRGRMAINAAALSTGIKLRDHHLRSRAFFDVRNHPEVVVEANEIAEDGRGLRLRGELLVRGQRHPFDCVAIVETLSSHQIALDAEAEFDLNQLGMSRGLAHMIPAGVTAHVRIVLHREIA